MLHAVLPCLLVAAHTPAPRLFPSVAELAAQRWVANAEGAAATPAATPATAGEAAPAAADMPAETPASTAAQFSDSPSAPTAPAAGGTLEVARRVAVYELELQEVEKNIGTVVTDSLLAEIRKLQGVSAIGMDEIRDMLSHEANKQILGCESDESCLAEIAGALGVDDLVSGKLSKVGDNHVIVVRRINQRQAKVVGVFNKRLKAESGQEFLLSVGAAVEELFADRQLRPGVSRGVPEEVALRLNPPPLPTFAFWTVAGGAAAAAVVGGAFGLLALGEERAFHGMIDSNTTGSIDGAELMAHGRAAETNALAANISYGTAGALAITAGIMFLFTDWEGYRQQLEAQQQ